MSFIFRFVEEAVSERDAGPGTTPRTLGGASRPTQASSETVQGPANLHTSASVSIQRLYLCVLFFDLLSRVIPVAVEGICMLPAVSVSPGPGPAQHPPK
jgi:hypothetical protein